ncbi:MAG: GNAT family N-acetyltransferase [Candidatus Heimdallarchaeota archaeon]|nr:GNAT family N-acetyltransferase [Candidatus Heimdallarchaeota archaeon]
MIFYSKFFFNSWDSRLLYEYPQDKRAELLSLFEEHKYLEAIVLGLVISDLGKILVDDLKKPRNAMLMFGTHSTVIVFGGTGVGDAAKELISKIPNKSGFLCPNDKWKSLVVEQFGDKLKYKPRIKFSSKSLDIEHIKKLKNNIPTGYEIVQINEEIIEKFEENTKRKIIRFVGSLDKFRKDGFGFVAIKNNRIIGDVTNGGLLYKNAFELDIEVHPDHRRKGLATILAAYLIEYSLENGYDPHWDAANKPSGDLALKLGYTNPVQHEFMVYWDDYNE